MKAQGSATIDFQTVNQAREALRVKYRQAERELLAAAGDEDRSENARNALLALRQEAFLLDPECRWVPQNLGPEAEVREWLQKMREAADRAGGELIHINPPSDQEAA